MTLLHNYEPAGGSEPNYEQQTFLGASIVSFNCNAGFGDTSSTLNVELAEDEYNKSDETPIGQGHDVYHNGKRDIFKPPPVGSPVFFTFGYTRSTVVSAFDSDSSPHFKFGGILQSFSQNRSAAGMPLYSVQVTDPREVLSNVQFIFNNYAGSTYSKPNILNIYGFLEFDSAFYNNEQYFQNQNKTTRLKLSGGNYSYYGWDMWYEGAIGSYIDSVIPKLKDANLGPPTSFPITGTGMSRRGPQGIPYYRIMQALNALSGFNGKLPDEYVNAGFGGYINFRGLNYIVDLRDLPTLPQFYYFDYDQMSVLDFCLEICDATNRELYVELLPVTDNKYPGVPASIIAGVIKVRAIDKSTPPSFGSIKAYIDSVEAGGIPIESRDIGYELANNTTDKFVVGGQDISMYYFTTNTDRNKIGTRQSKHPQWRLDCSLEQQVLPYYGLLGDRIVTIPKGFGSYQQILLDARSVQANGVTDYYVATEMELRAALVSFETWSEFLLSYNNIYLEPVSNGDIRASVAASMTTIPGTATSMHVETATNYSVTVPRSVFDTSEYNGQAPRFIGSLPASTCNPPYGWPLYYKRATQIGLPQAGLASFAATNRRILEDVVALKNAQPGREYKALLNTIWKDWSSKAFSAESSQAEKDFYTAIKAAIDNNISVAFSEDSLKKLGPIVAGTEREAKKGMDNAKKVYNFLKAIAEECLGKKFLVKIPPKVNSNYSLNIKTQGNGVNLEIRNGPFGFMPRQVNNNPAQTEPVPGNKSMTTSFLIKERGDKQYYGALQTEFNPITNDFEFNYSPEKQGGFFDFQNNAAAAISIGFLPKDLSSILKENNRLSGYVRFDSSQDLSFSNLSKEDYTQQYLEGGYVVPDVSYQLENSSDSYDKLNIRDEQKKTPAIAFVKCDIDSNFYFAPSMSMYSINVYGSTYTEPTYVFSKPQKIFDPTTATHKDTFSVVKRQYSPLPNTPTSTIQVKEFDCIRNPNSNPFAYKDRVSKDHVYALITLPGRVVPTLTSRYRSATTEAQTKTFNHFLRLDVIKDLPEFSTPQMNIKPQTNFHNNNVPLGQGAEAALRKAYHGIAYGLPTQINFAAPSPVYPDLVALPLLSHERCYGPWISSISPSTTVGGKIEFIKDESLTPWNYGGFDLMNKAGILQAQFGYGALLTTERGGFVVPAPPVGVSLASSLIAGGPLVTNLSISVSQAGVKTTYKMDTYTTSFGKMQKQAKDAITNIHRNRQKMIDYQNTIIKNGFAKSQTNVNYSDMYNRYKAQSLPVGHDIFPEANLPEQTVMSVTPIKEYGSTVPVGGNLNTGILGSQSKTLVQGSLNNTDIMAKMAGIINADTRDVGFKSYNTASSSVTDMQTPASHEPEHPLMSVVAKPTVEVVDSLLSIENRKTETFQDWR